jgi:hypothetical protein
MPLGNTENGVRTIEIIIDDVASTKVAFHCYPGPNTLADFGWRAGLHLIKRMASFTNLLCGLILAGFADIIVLTPSTKTTIYSSC